MKAASYDAPAESSDTGAAAAVLPDRTQMGTIELRTAALAPMRDFYVDAVAACGRFEAGSCVLHRRPRFRHHCRNERGTFLRRWWIPHHLATNTWNSVSAKTKGVSAGLGSLAIHLGDEAALQAVAQRLNAAGLTFTHETGLITVNDPWGNTVRLLA